jgi:hypothetical protein
VVPNVSKYLASDSIVRRRFENSNSASLFRRLSHDEVLLWSSGGLQIGRLPRRFIPLPQVQSLHDAVLAVINQPQGKAATRFIQATEYGNAPNLVQVCTNLIQSSDAVAFVEKEIAGGVPGHGPAEPSLASTSGMWPTESE